MTTTKKKKKKKKREEEGEKKKKEAKEEEEEGVLNTLNIFACRDISGWTTVLNGAVILQNGIAK